MIIDDLFLPDVQRAIEENIDRDPLQIALDGRVPCAASVATEVKYLQRARTKLPSYFAARAILPSLAFEQSSSEECAFRRNLSGDKALDLTCGLGVDSLALSRHFAHVVAIERSEETARIARENFRRMGVTNVDVVCSSAEEYLASCADHFDWCFIDPDRRSPSGKKLVLLEDCSPNVVALREQIARVADNLWIKCSPLFDTAEAFRKFGNCTVETVSLKGECKEVNIIVDSGNTQRIAAEAIGLGRVETLLPIDSPAWSEEPADISQYRYLILPDAAVQHSRLVGMMCAKHGADAWSDNGVALSTTKPVGIVGRVATIVEAQAFDPKQLKKRLSGRAIEILRRDFPLSNNDLCRRLDIREGGDERWCFFRTGRKLWAAKIEFL